MRCKEEYRALLGKINMQRTVYAEREMMVSEELERKIQFTQEDIKKWDVRIVIAFLGVLFSIGILYEVMSFYFNAYKYGFYMMIAGVVIILILLGVQWKFKKRLKTLLKQKEDEQADKVHIRQAIANLNEQIKSLVVSIITINEHFYELSTIKEEKRLYEKWQQYTNEVISAINQKYQYKASYNDYQEYYREYENYLEEKEKNE